jgi:hypothetical protein
MTFNEIEQALGQQAATLDYPIAWPNKDYDPKAANAVPHIEFRHVPTLRTDDSIDGGHEVQTGIALLTVVVNRDGFATEANGIAQEIAEAFPYGFRIETATGTVMVSKPADPVAGFVDGVYYRLPVRVSYRTTPLIA